MLHQIFVIFALPHPGGRSRTKYHLETVSHRDSARENFVLELVIFLREQTCLVSGAEHFTTFMQRGDILLVWIAMLVLLVQVVTLEFGVNVARNLSLFGVLFPLLLGCRSKLLDVQAPFSKFASPVLSLTGLCSVDVLLDLLQLVSWQRVLPARDIFMLEELGPGVCDALRTKTGSHFAVRDDTSTITRTLIN